MESDIKRTVNGFLLYRAYLSMKCRIKSAPYRLKKITICDEWLGENGFLKFYEWSIANGFKYIPMVRGSAIINSLTLDRISPLGNYEPSNCRWTTWNIQYANKTKYTKRVCDNENIFGKRLKQCLKEKNIKPIELARGIGIEKGNLSSYINGFLNPPKFKTILKMANFIGVDVDYLLYANTEVKK